MLLNALVEKLKRRSKDDFKGRHYEATLILQAVSWYLRYPLSYRDIEELFLERGLEVDHSTLNRWLDAAKRFFRKMLKRSRCYLIRGYRFGTIKVRKRIGSGECPRGAMGKRMGSKSDPKSCTNPPSGDRSEGVTFGSTNRQQNVTGANVTANGGRLSQSR
jgi:hypothetical protein